MIDVVMPTAGERVVEVPQSLSHLVGYDTRYTLHGQSAESLTRYVAQDTGVRWKVYEPLHDPCWGFGLLVVRGGRCWRGPYQWDSGD